MSTVTHLRESQWEKDGQPVTTFYVTIDDIPNEVPCYSAEAKALEEGKPLPDGWEVKTSQKGKKYLAPPKQRGGGGGQSSWYNSETGVRFTQERMDRRTALMQAVVWRGTGGLPPNVLHAADAFYDWLTKTRSVPTLSAPSAPVSSPSQAAPSIEGTGTPSTGTAGGVGGGTAEGGSADREAVAGSPSAPSVEHVHEWGPAPRQGWVVCSCGKAEKAKVAK